MSGFFSSICDLYILYWFNRRYTMRKNKMMRIGVCFLVIWGICRVEDYFDIGSLPILVGIITLTYIAVFVISYKESKSVILMRSISLVGSVMIGEILVSLVTMLLTVRYDLHIILDAANVRWIVIYTSAKICECLILNIINKITDLESKKDCGRIVIWNIVFLGSVLMCLYLYLSNIISSGGKPDMEQLFFIQLLILGLILVSYLNIMNRYYRMNHEKIELETFFREIKREAHYYEQTNALYEEIRKIKHDLKNFMILAEQPEEEYRKDIENYFQKFNNYVNSGNRILDLLIMNKAKLCQEKNINFQYQLTTTKLDQLNALDVISIFGNVLDNAIEACEKSIKKQIQLKTWETGGILFAEIINPATEIVMHHSKFITTKADKKSHGLGLTCVEGALKRYEGICEISVENGEFHVVLCIPIANVSSCTQKQPNYAE